MNRRQAVIAALSSLVVAVAGSKQALAQQGPAPSKPLDWDGKQIVAVSVFAGQGNTRNVDTGLKYAGSKVSPTWVGITPTGFRLTSDVGVFPHQSDTLIDVQVRGGVPWTGLALYIL
jgi:hypothetical protein